MRRLTSFAGIILVMIALLAVLGLAGCGSSAQTVPGEAPFQSVQSGVDLTQGEAPAEGGEDIDALLGLSEESPQEVAQQQPAAKEETIAEDDVLKLLGVDQGTQETAVKPVEANPATVKSDEGSKATQPPKTEPVRPSVTPPARTAQPVSPATFNNRYDEATKAYQSRDYRKAIQLYEALLAENMNHSLSDNCQYWIGESYWGLGMYQQAIAAFEKVFTFANSNKDPDAQLKLGLCYLRLNDKARAKEEFQKLIDNYPSSSYVSTARGYLAQINNGQD